MSREQVKRVPDEEAAEKRHHPHSLNGNDMYIFHERKKQNE